MILSQLLNVKRFLALLLLIVSFTANAQIIADYVPSKPAYARLFNDENAYAYYHKTWRKLEDKLINHQNRTGKQLVVVTISSAGIFSIEEIALETFRKWAIGDKVTNTGLLVLVARKEKKISIETGYGLEGEVPDITAKKIISSILKPALDSFNFILSPQHPQQGYLPAIERAIDTLITLTKEPNLAAIKNSGSKAIAKKKNTYKNLMFCLIIITGIIFFFKRWRRKTNKKIETDNIPARTHTKMNRNRTKRTAEGQYLYPLLILAAVLGATIFWKLNWLYFIVAAIILTMRWIYYLPPPTLKKETIEFNKLWDARIKKLKEEYKEKKKLLGNEKSYANFDAYWAKYIELGLDILEKELRIGVFAPRAVQSKKEYHVKSLLYDIFLGTTETEKKRSFSSTTTKGFSGDSTGGQSAGDYGGGSSGGGGANG